MISGQDSGLNIDVRSDIQIKTKEKYQNRVIHNSKRNYTPS